MLVFRTSLYRWTLHIKPFFFPLIQSLAPFFLCSRSTHWRTALLKDGNLLMRGDLDYQAIKAENQESNNPFSYSQHQYSQEQEAMPDRTYQNPLLTDTSQ